MDQIGDQVTMTNGLGPYPCRMASRIEVTIMILIPAMQSTKLTVISLNRPHQNTYSDRTKLS